MTTSAQTRNLASTSGVLLHVPQSHSPVSPVAAFEFTLLLLVAVLGLELLAKVLRLPPAAALIAGGIVLAFVPGFPTVSLDPELVLVLFLPPRLMDGAYFTAWADFRRNLGGILLLAIGAVAFTTLVDGLVARWIVPDLPWAAYFALGAVVSPPDAIAARQSSNAWHCRAGLWCCWRARACSTTPRAWFCSALPLQRR